MGRGDGRLTAKGRGHGDGGVAMVTEAWPHPQAQEAAGMKDVHLL